MSISTWRHRKQSWVDPGQVEKKKRKLLVILFFRFILQEANLHTAFFVLFFSGWELCYLSIIQENRGAFAVAQQVPMVSSNNQVKKKVNEEVINQAPTS